MFAFIIKRKKKKVGRGKREGGRKRGRKKKRRGQWDRGREEGRREKSSNVY